MAPEARLKALEGFLAQRFPAARVSRTERRDVFARRDMPVVAVEVARPADVPLVFRPLERAFPDLKYADVDLQLSIRYAARTGLFPLARCRLEVDSAGRIRQAEALDSPWDLEHAAAAAARAFAGSGCGPGACRAAFAARARG